jgi:hypothetical protein
MMLTFEDTTTLEMPTVEYFRRKTQKEYEVIREARDNDGAMWMTCMLEGGREITINAEYVN